MEAALSRWMSISVAAVLCITTAPALGMDMVVVGDPGNEGELSGEGVGGYGPNRICGAVDYTYRMAKHEVTAAQYTAFLNDVVAHGDPHELYNVNMGSHDQGCNIQRSGGGTAADPYVFTVPADYRQRPVNFVSWYDAARFCNWMTGGTTETGSYDLTGGDTMAVTRSAGAVYALPSEDEWYKAAFYDAAADNYYTFPTQSNTAPSNDLVSPDPGNNANYWAGDDDYTLGAPYWLTEVGSFENSESPYGTFDQAGNVWEWTEEPWDDESRVGRGGSFLNTWYNHLMAGHRGRLLPANHYAITGLRVVLIPEPAAIFLLAMGGVLLFGLKRRR